MILLTTSDYLPQLGGLSTFTKNIEIVLNELKIDYELFHWKNYQEIEKFDAHKLAGYSHIINIHPQFSWMSNSNHEHMINFIHGSEILMTSPNPIKKLFKKINKKYYFQKLSRSNLNIFISEATLGKAQNAGFKIDYSRDLILHNCIDTKDSSFVKKDILGHLVFSCIVRNVPHKNLVGSLRFCEIVSEITGKSVELIVPKNSMIHSQKIKITELSDSSDNQRDEAYRLAHFNLLLSEDHSSKGFFEGFGLTVLEAGRFGTPSIVMNTGGLPEAVHHAETGWVINAIDKEAIANLFSRENEARYQQMRIDCYNHTIRSHSLNEYAKILRVILQEVRGAA